MLCFCVGEHMVGGGSAAASGLSGPADGAGDRGDPSALPGQETAHPRRHRGQKAVAAERLRRICRPPYRNIRMVCFPRQQFFETSLRQLLVLISWM